MNFCRCQALGERRNRHNLCQPGLPYAETAGKLARFCRHQLTEATPASQQVLAQANRIQAAAARAQKHRQQFGILQTSSTVGKQPFCWPAGC
jgi:hypothetical protein